MRNWERTMPWFYYAPDSGAGSGGSGEGNNPPANPPATDPPANPPADPPANPDSGNGKTKIEDLPEDIQKYIRELREENATKRKAAEAAEKAAREAAEKELAEQNKYKELFEKRDKDYNDLQTRIADMERKALIAKVAKAHGLPDELAERLKGETEDELSADAKSLSGLVKKSAPPTDAGKGSGGSGGGTARKESGTFIFNRPGDVAWPK